MFDLSKITSKNRLVGMWRMMTGFRRTYGIATISLGLATVANTTSFLLLRYFVDELLERGGNTDFALIALGFVGLALVNGTFTFFSGRLAAHTAEGVVRHLRNYLYDHIQRLSFRYHDKTQTGELMQRTTSDVDTIRRLLADQAIGVGRILMLFSINFTAILLLNWQLALFSVMIIPLIVLISVFFFAKISKIYAEHQDQEAKLLTTLQENLSGIRVVKVFARQDWEREKFEADNHKKFMLGRRLIMMHGYYWPITDTLSGIQMLAGFALGALMAINGTISIGAYLAYAGMIIWIIWPIRNLGRLVVDMSEGLVSYERVMELIHESREPLTTGNYTPEGDLRGAIEFQNVSFEYDADIPVLRDISFQAKAGQIVALLGAPGAGKTSLVGLLPRFYEYTAGRLTLDGVELRDYPRHYLRRHIGIVEQEPFLFSRTIRENISYGVARPVTDAEIEAAARAAAIHDVILSFPKGYNTLVGERGVTLSGGQKQRVAIARTLLKDPRLLILDDSTSAVDTATEAGIWDALETLMEGRTTFIIAHRIHSVMKADLILVLDKGAIVQRGTHAELLAQPGPYKEIYDLQSQVEDETEKEVEHVDLPV